ncbi:MAG: DNA topoisomerase III [Candidatus Accumulibacter sp. SK-11]|nr:MAG: DNA topoisomerase III [Candidatus Accumulibacter sp. SK-11]
MAYVCEKSVTAGRSCDFRSGTVILQQPIEPEQMRKLLADGRSELLRGFVSARTRRKFSAYLVRGSDGKVGFEFEKREPRTAAAKARTASAKPAAAATGAPPSAAAARRRKAPG